MMAVSGKDLFCCMTENPSLLYQQSSDIATQTDDGRKDWTFHNRLIDDVDNRYLEAFCCKH